MRSPKQVTLIALNNSMGDDLYRAQSAWRNLSEWEMQEEYGQSGKTRTEILRSYQEHHDEIEAAIEWVSGL